MRRRHALVVAAVAVTMVTACGGNEAKDEGGDAKVATLTSTAPGKATPSKTAAQRPRERLDTTPEEFEAMLGPYHKCLKERGYAPDELKRKLAEDAKPAVDAASKEMDEAYRICEAQFYPLPPWEKDPANPEARDFAVAVVKCLKNKGVKYVEVAEDGLSYALGGEKNDKRSISMGLDLAPECEREVAAKNK
ncbi:hypothetical protein [Paractinoplanes brasiliensis]|uniref:Lipoprotein n=1 Tax=Paractinoplanes brasiliensis TaxID=52695 RepID=A0A4R6JTX6_9ACTN|nr:hypothetical protein [Actinoplanes brasiliensis]TDO38921.1 hypothetical protein C8E87_2588 [Actinoplanes brasiliensis]GID26301.1 hypothetical protein Abr02nite_12840 [Actinoplanes brasiliensis]